MKCATERTIEGEGVNDIKSDWDRQTPSLRTFGEGNVHVHNFYVPSSLCLCGCCSVVCLDRWATVCGLSRSKGRLVAAQPSDVFQMVVCWLRLGVRRCQGKEVLHLSPLL